MSGTEIPPFVPHVPSPLEAWAAAKYHPPLFESYPVLRVPIAGPDPYNTLVVVRSSVWLGVYQHADGKLRRYSASIGTGFSLIGFDPRVGHPYEHSSTAVLQMMQTSDDTSFVIAADRVDGFFDDTGRWVFSVEWADAWDEVYAAGGAYASGWILCWEPPPPSRPWDHINVRHRVRDRWALLERTDVALDRGVERYREIAAKRHERRSAAPQPPHDEIDRPHRADPFDSSS